MPLILATLSTLIAPLLIQYRYVITMAQIAPPFSVSRRRDVALGPDVAGDAIGHLDGIGSARVA